MQMAKLCMNKKESHWSQKQTWNGTSPIWFQKMKSRKSQVILTTDNNDYLGRIFWCFPQQNMNDNENI